MLDVETSSFVSIIIDGICRNREGMFPIRRNVLTESMFCENMF